MNKIIYTTVLKEHTPIRIILLVYIAELLAYIQRTISKPYYIKAMKSDTNIIQYPKISNLLAKLIPTIPEKYLVLEE